MFFLEETMQIQGVCEDRIKSIEIVLAGDPLYDIWNYDFPSFSKKESLDGFVAQNVLHFKENPLSK